MVLDLPEADEQRGAGDEFDRHKPPVGAGKLLDLIDGEVDRQEGRGQQHHAEPIHLRGLFRSATISATMDVPSPPRFAGTAGFIDVLDMMGSSFLESPLIHSYALHSAKRLDVVDVEVDRQEGRGQQHHAEPIHLRGLFRVAFVG